jgi:hypothetical protein
MKAIAPDLRRSTLLVVGALLAAVAATAAPLAVYASTLAAFGLWHVAAEMRYVATRFSGRFPHDLATFWMALLALLVVVRLNDSLGGRWPGGRSVWEIAILVALVLGTLRFAAIGDRARALLAAGGIACFCFFGFREPIATLAVLAFAHNLTPIGFLLERFEGRERRRVAAISVVVFFVIPVAVLFEVPFFPRFSIDALATQAFGGLGTIENHFGSFLPPNIVDRPIAARLFACAVYLQSVHYFTVIEILPRLTTPRAAPRRFDGKKVAVGLAAASLGLYFAVSFPDARRLYAVPAAVHAFVEWPLFLALILSQKPSAQTAPLPA